MLAAIREPLTPRQLTLSLVGVAAAVALYCVGYSAPSGRSESLIAALGWALANVCPWLVALEGAKRAKGPGGVAIALALGFAASLTIGFALAGAEWSWTFEAWRRIPALAVLAVIAAVLRWDRVRARRNAAEPLPLLPRQIDWVQAAGNYVELRAGGRTIVHRTSITAAERDLAGHGFVRIHRSTLVRRDRIARVRPADIILTDGTHLKVGKRFRSQLSN
jgi:hypothetical protein